MKKMLLTLLSAFVIACGFAQNAPTLSSQAQASFDKTVHDYGHIQKGANGACTFVLTNTGTAPLVISKCKGSCGCTVPICPETPIQPGASKKIEVKYDTKRPGPIGKTVTVTTNDPDQPTILLKIKGFVERDAGSETAKSTVQN